MTTEQSIVSYFVVGLPQRIRNICLLAAVVAGEYNLKVRQMLSKYEYNIAPVF